MLDLRCLECKINDKSQQYFAELIDNANKKYQLIINDFIPKNKIIRLNPYYHDFVEIDDFIRIKIKQKYDRNNQPKILELELIDFYNLSSGTILTLQDTNTHDLLKMKVDLFDKEIGFIEILNLGDLNMIICSMPHYYDKYLIENWIFFNNIIETL